MGELAFGQTGYIRAHVTRIILNQCSAHMDSVDIANIASRLTVLPACFGGGAGSLGCWSWRAPGCHELNVDYPRPMAFPDVGGPTH
jgi:hypothetical protein